MITNKNEAKAMTNYYSNYISYKKNYNWNRSTCIGENNKYLKSIADTAMTECNEIIIFMDNVSTKKTNTKARNVTSTASLSCHSVKGRDCYILHTVLLAIILPLINIIACCHYAKLKGTL